MTHFIDKVTFEIRLKRSHNAFALQQSCSDLMHEQLGSVIEQLLDSYSDKYFERPSEHIIFNRVEVDLGKLSYDNFVSQVRERFIHEFSTKLVKIQTHERTDAKDLPDVNSAFKYLDNRQSTLTDAQLGLNIFVHFLSFGTIPWYADTKQFAGMNSCFEQILRNSQSTLKPLKNALNNPVALTRLLTQFDFESVSLLYQKIFTTNINWQDLINNSRQSIEMRTGRIEGEYFDSFSVACSNKELWRKIWLHSLRSHSRDTILADLFANLLASAPMPQHLILQRLIEHLPDLSKRTNIPEERISEVLNKLKFQLVNKDFKSDESTSTLLDEMRLIEGERAADLSPLSSISNNTNDEISLNRKEKIDHKENLILPPQPRPTDFARENDNQTDFAHQHQSEIKANTNMPHHHIQHELTGKGSRPGRETMNGKYDVQPVTHTPDNFTDSLSERYVINNAGLVFFWPYLQIFFNDLALLTQNKFKDDIAQQKALLLLQFLVTGEEYPLEYHLTLNKILCNWPLDKPVERFIRLNKRDKDEANALLTAVIEHWSSLGSTSVQNFRGTFVNRAGLLEKNSQGWLLRVESGPYDILIDKLPWGISMIKLSWMDELLSVDWNYGR